MKLGTIISMPDSPNTNYFAFVINEDSISHVKKGQFVEVEYGNGKLIGMIMDIFRSNRYFERAESVAEYERTGMLSAHFPIDEWSYTVAQVKIVGVYENKLLKRCSFPPSPGRDVMPADESLLKNYLGFKDNGIHIGNLFNHESVEVKLGLSKLFQKHLAILAMSGAGKSYLMSVILEELAERKPEDGRLGVVVIDVHGEYVNLKKSPLGDRVKVYDGNSISIGLKNVAVNMFPNYYEMSDPQKRILKSVLSEMRSTARKQHAPFTIRDLIQRLEGELQSDNASKKAIPGLIQHLEDLNSFRLFKGVDSPAVSDLVKPGQISIINLRSIDDDRKRQAIVSYFSKKLFEKVKAGKIPPFLLVIEEAHNFVADKARKEMISKGVIETIAREGRKFGAALCLISQRPVRLSTTVLSQCNTHIILRVTNPYDVAHIGNSSEGIDKYMLDSITSLQVGEALVVGEAVKRPIFVQVRKRKYDWDKADVDLEELARRFEQEDKNKLEDVGAFI